MITLSIYALLGILEIILILLTAVVVLFYQWRAARRTLSRSRGKAAHSKAPDKSGQKTVRGGGDSGDAHRDYAGYLREQLERSDRLLGEQADHDAQGALDAVAQANGDEAELDTSAPADGEVTPPSFERQMLAARHQFLQLELDVQTKSGARDPRDQRDQIVEGMRALLDGLQLDADDDLSEADGDADAATDSSRANRSEEDKLRDQVGFLRSVIDNQHAVMKELRDIIEEHAGDSDELRAALGKLSVAEKESRDMKKRLLEIRRGQPPGASTKDDQEGGSSPDTDMLKNLVGSQQRTIQNLKQMLHKVSPDNDKAEEFAAAMDKIQRTNNELNSCVMLLEEENDMLRTDVEELQRQLAERAAQATNEPVAESPPIDQDIAAEVPVVTAEVNTTDDVDLPEVPGAPAGVPVSAMEETHDPEQEVSTKPIALTQGESEQDDIDALLESVGAGPEPKPASDAAKAAAAPPPPAKPADQDADSSPKIKPLTQGESEQDDIDALLNDLLGDDANRKQN